MKPLVARTLSAKHGETELDDDTHREKDRNKDRPDNLWELLANNHLTFQL